ncbi:DUF4350 domain-containing protein [Bacteroides sp.]
MKLNRWFIVGIVLFLCIMFVVELNMPKKFVWTPTFGQHDRQPFGCAVFDDVVESTLPGEYTISDETFYQMYEYSDEPMGIICIAEHLPLSSTDVEAIFGLAEEGSTVLLAANSFGQVLEDTLGFNTSYSFFSAKELKRYATASHARDRLVWLKDSTYDECAFRFYPQLCKVGIEPWDSTLLVPIVERWDVKPDEYVLAATADSLEMKTGRVPVAMRYRAGSGEIIIVTTPLLFTNYGMLDAGNADYLFRFLNSMKDFPVVRVEAYTASHRAEQSPFKYFLSQRPLRWGLYLTLIVLLLFMIFSAKRKQRVIPVVREPENKSLEFTELIGTLYYQKKNHADLVRKKFIYFAENLRRNYQIDVEDSSDDEALARQIALKTGGDAGKIFSLLRSLRLVLGTDVKVSESQMQGLIDAMNEASPPGPLQ